MQVLSAATDRLLGRLWQNFPDAIWIADPPLEYELVCEDWKSESRDWEEARTEFQAWCAMPDEIEKPEALPPVEKDVLKDAMTQLRKVLHERRQAGIPTERQPRSGRTTPRPSGGPTRCCPGLLMRTTAAAART